MLATVGLAIELFLTIVFVMYTSTDLLDMEAATTESIMFATATSLSLCSSDSQAAVEALNRVGKTSDNI
jgi:hypothetical protein